MSCLLLLCSETELMLDDWVHGEMMHELGSL